MGVSRTYAEKATLNLRATEVCAMSKENAWGIGLMLISVALAVFVGKIMGAVCGVLGIAIIGWAQFLKRGTERAKIREQREIKRDQEVVELAKALIAATGTDSAANKTVPSVTLRDKTLALAYDLFAFSGRKDRSRKPRLMSR